jgi:hypothetical protein
MLVCLPVDGGGIHRGKISAEVGAENSASKTIYYITIKNYIKTFKPVHFSGQMSALILPV